MEGTGLPGHASTRLARHARATDFIGIRTVAVHRVATGIVKIHTALACVVVVAGPRRTRAAIVHADIGAFAITAMNVAVTTAVRNVTAVLPEGQTLGRCFRNGTAVRDTSRATDRASGAGRTAGAIGTIDEKAAAIADDAALCCLRITERLLLGRRGGCTIRLTDIEAGNNLVTHFAAGAAAAVNGRRGIAAAQPSITTLKAKIVAAQLDFIDRGDRIVRRIDRARHTDVGVFVAFFSAGAIAAKQTLAAGVLDAAADLSSRRDCLKRPFDFIAVG